MPIVLVISVFQIFVFDGSIEQIASMFSSGLLVVGGLAFFMFGLRLALFPIGEKLAYTLAKKGSVVWLVTFAFSLGFGTTFAEPALIAIVREAASVAANGGIIASTTQAQESYAFGLRLTVAVAVGSALVIGVMRIVLNWSLPVLIIGGYILIILITAFAPEEVVGIAYDLGGVTTSTVTLPLVTALGIGLASSLRGRNPLTDGFGLIAFAALAPILFVLLYGVAVQWN